MQYTLGQVVDANRNTAREEWITNWSVFALYRRPGILLAWALLRTGATPNKVTAVSLILAVLMPIAAIVLPLSIAGSLVCVMAVAFQVLDCTDGSMARVTGQGSALGARYDFLVDMFQWGLLYCAIGILADRMVDGGTFWTMVGFAAAWLRLFARVCNDTVPDDEERAPDQDSAWTLMWALNGLSGLIPFMLLLGPHVWLAVCFVLLYSIGDVIDALTRVIE